MKRILLTLVVLTVVAGIAGCPVYSKQEFGREMVRGETLEQLITQNGAPDMIGSVGDYTVLGWSYVEGFEILQLFGTVEKRTTAVVVDRTGKVIATGSVDGGSGISVIGAEMVPVHAVRVK